jgi:hypothetical protein
LTGHNGYLAFQLLPRFSLFGPVGVDGDLADFSFSEGGDGVDRTYKLAACVGSTQFKFVAMKFIVTKFGNHRHRVTAIASQDRKTQCHFILPRAGGYQTNARLDLLQARSVTRSIRFAVVQQ